ncbi:potassium channel family protein [Glaciibacter psychrotolerans]|uniref:Trk system potassium uptake protein TrkA n=1 Tax=Glaciibacter psychrotolerans TaxID=670054 RepID=A0A7Z0J6Z6_9MICO|nr:TrkA family potassium uptake protein [Leifsonia psychrotolerans]NYJ20945.1 trk system potassium uptake protein TrkA [Leifsonia psychrotolerans]
MVRLSFSPRDSTRRIAEADSVAVIGLGRFGSALALELMDYGTEVLGIDSSEEIVQAHNGLLTQVVRADSTKEEALRQLAVHEFDRVVVAIGSDIKASILTASLLLRFEVPVVWAKALDDQHGLILEQLGVGHVVYPETSMGKRVAHLVRGAAMDFIEIDRDYAIVKTSPNSVVIGRRLGDTGVRASYGITVTSVRRENGAWANADADTILQETDTILVAGPIRKAEEFAQLR